MVVKYAQAEQKNIELVEKLQKAEAAMKDCVTENDNLTTYLHTLRADKQKLKDLLEKRFVTYLHGVSKNQFTIFTSFLTSDSSCFFQLFLSGFLWYKTPEVDWKGRLGVLVRNLRTMRVVCWVNVSESFGAGSLGLSRIFAVDIDLVQFPID